MLQKGNTMSQMSSKLKGALKQIIADVNREVRAADRNLLLRAAAAMGGAYHATQAEYALNASIPVKYAVLDRFTEDLEKYRERSRLTEVQNRFTNTAEPAYYRGLRMAVPVAEYELSHRTGHLLIELLDVYLWGHSHVTFKVDDVKLVKVEETVTIWLPPAPEVEVAPELYSGAPEDTEALQKATSGGDDRAAQERLTWMLLA